MAILKKQRIALGVILCTAIGVMAYAYPGKGSSAWEGTPGSQDVRSLDRRISSLEQRLYSIESNISRLQQSATSRRVPVSPPDIIEQQVNLLRAELQTLQQRLNEVECGLVKLDERTTASAVREARRSPGARASDPCRLNPAAPLRLSTRP